MPVAPVRGCDLAYNIVPTVGGADDAPPLVWGHGLMGSRGASRAYPLVDLEDVSRHRSVVRYDARGHGWSDVLTNPEMGSWHELALDQIALIDHLGYDRVSLGGVSMGAGTALHSALLLNDRLERMVLVIPPTGWDERAPQVAAYEQSAALVERDGCQALVAAMAALAPPAPFAGSTIAADRRAGTLGGADPVRTAACLRGAGYADLPSLEAIATIKTPTLVLAWSGDPGHPVSTARALEATLPNVEMHVADTAAEFATWSDRIAQFLR